MAVTSQQDFRAVVFFVNCGLSSTPCSTLREMRVLEATVRELKNTRCTRCTVYYCMQGEAWMRIVLKPTTYGESDQNNAIVDTKI